MFSHEKLDVYQCSAQWLALSNEIVKALPKGNADLANQLRRATFSVPLNIAEGAGKISLLDKKRFYAIARGSALECVAIMDAIEILALCESSNILKAKKLLYRIVSMLSKLCVK